MLIYIKRYQMQPSPTSKTSLKRCIGKVRHTNIQTAQDALNLMLHKDNSARKSLNIYSCPACKNWHIGHRRKELVEIKTFRKYPKNY